MNIIVEGLAVSYSDHGHRHKQTILMLHGWGDNAETFTALAETLSKTYRVICVDLPGFGKTGIPDKPWNLDDYGLFVSNFLRKLDLDLYGVIGHSNGGAIAIRAISLGILKPKKLILLASAGIHRPYTFRNTTLKALTKSSKVILHLAPQKTKDKLRHRLYQRIGPDYLVAEGMKETLKNIVKHDVLEDARSVKIPTALIYGDLDHATPQAYGMLFADVMPDAKLHVLEGAGHYVHLDEPKVTDRIIEEFLL